MKANGLSSYCTLKLKKKLPLDTCLCDDYRTRV